MFILKTSSEVFFVWYPMYMKLLRWPFVATLTRYDVKSGKEWTLKEILKELTNELSPLGCKLKGSELWFDDRRDFYVGFIRNRFPPDDLTVEINGSITVTNNENAVFVHDLFSLGKTYYGKKYRSLGIYRDQTWANSTIQHELQDFYLPLLQKVGELPLDKVNAEEINKIVIGLKKAAHTT